MLIFTFAAAMMLTMLIATALAVHNEAQRSRQPTRKTQMQRHLKLRD